MRLGQVFLAVSLISLMVTPGVRAQAQLQVSEVGLRYEFGTQITITARLQAGDQIQSASLFIQPENGTSTLGFPLEPGPDGRVEYRYEVQPGVLRPFEHVYFWFSVTLNNGQVLTSSRYSFRYEDNRFNWQTLEDGSLRVHWYEGDETFGQQALDAGRNGLAAAQRLVFATPSSPVEIFIYASPADLQSALNMDTQAWLVGHAAVDLSVVLVSIAPGPQQSLSMDEQLPHEITHVLLYVKAGKSYASLPEWLREGMASLAEQYPNPDYSRVMNNASASNSLIPLHNLCGAFPPDEQQNFLAYAESASFVRFLYDTYGTQGLDTAITAYAGGLSCELGAARSFGKSLTQLESDWRESVLGENMTGVALRNLMPYIVVALVILLIPLWQLAIQKQERNDSDEYFPN